MQGITRSLTQPIKNDKSKFYGCKYCSKSNGEAERKPVLTWLNYLLQTGERREETSHIHQVNSEFADCNRLKMKRDRKPARLPAINNDSLPFLSKSVLRINLPSDAWPLLVIERYAIWSGLDIPGVLFPVTGSQPMAPIDVRGARWHHLVSILAFEFLTASVHKLQSTSGYCQRDWHHFEVLHSLSTYWKQRSAVSGINPAAQRCMSVRRSIFSRIFHQRDEVIHLVKDCNGWAKYSILGRRQYFGYLDMMLPFTSVFNDAFRSRINYLLCHALELDLAIKRRISVFIHKQEKDQADAAMQCKHLYGWTLLIAGEYSGFLIARLTACPSCDDLARWRRKEPHKRRETPQTSAFACTSHDTERQP